MDTRPLQTIGWACTRFGVSRDSIYAWVRAGWIPHCRIGRRILFDDRAVEAFIARGGMPLPSGRSGTRDQTHEQVSA
jgi:excisionase family DNA binding protein